MSGHNLRAIKNAIVEQHLKGLPLMDVEEMREGVLVWLRQFPWPGGEGRSWEETVKIFPPDESDRLETSGLRIRLTVNLHTSRHTYLISIMESLSLDSREVYILSAHTNWNHTEKRLQKALEQEYMGRFEDVLRARHTIWAQTFQRLELVSALDACAAALLSRELVDPETKGDGDPDAPPKGLTCNKVQPEDRTLDGAGTLARPATSPADFPQKDEDQST